MMMNRPFTAQVPFKPPNKQRIGNGQTNTFVKQSYYLVALPSVGDVGTSTVNSYDSSHLVVCRISWYHVVVWKLVLFT